MSYLYIFDIHLSHIVLPLHLELLPAIRAVRPWQLGPDPLHDALAVEDVLAGCLSDYALTVELFKADATGGLPEGFLALDKGGVFGGLELLVEFIEELISFLSAFFL